MRRRASSPAHPSLGPARVSLLVLMLAAFAAVTTEMLPVGLLPTIGRALGASESTMGLVVSLYAAMVALLAVPLVLATRRVAGKRLLVIATSAYAVSNLICALAPNLAVFAGARALGGVTHALFYSVCIGYGARLAPAGQTGRALSLVAVGASAGFAFGVPVATVLGNAVGWRASFFALTALMVAALVLVAVVLPDLGAPDPEASHGHRGRRQFAAAVSSNAVAFLGHFTLYTYVTVLLLRSGAPVGLVGSILLIFGTAGLVGVSIAGRQIDRRPRLSALVILVVVALGIVAAGLGTAVLALVIVAGVVWIGAFGGVPSMYQTAAVRTRYTSPELAGAWVNMTSNIGIAAGAAVGGRALEAFGMPAVVALASGLVAASAVIVLFARQAFPDRADGDHPDQSAPLTQPAVAGSSGQPH